MTDEHTHAVFGEVGDGLSEDFLVTGEGIRTGIRVIEFLRDHKAVAERAKLLHLQCELARLEVAKQMGISVLPIQIAWPELIAGVFQEGGGFDHFIIGDRGGGKTALGVRLAQEYVACGLRGRCIGLSDRAASAVALEPVEYLEREPGSVLVVDEAGMVERDQKEFKAAIRERMATARHDESVTIFIAQSGAQVPPEAFRFRGALWVKKYDNLASIFDREELQEHLAGLVQLWGGTRYIESPAGVLCRIGDQVLVTSNPLPEGWSDDVSRNWQGRTI